ncbi:type III polyketide synthase [Salirhabdus salicampi]|uniref:type III polyketide synthase n=1 Tax=Salirhabdus salicampi TaxID=476102 RepID=UPI0020C4EBFB|nr:3-oxoacyl-[acyl-carrier-protein] synthase III C-terminal domain-containing protein [Salirhabdus salicampi]MCP8616082.1 type III polyketide synthase [Salirhabdus salicampi]
MAYIASVGLSIPKHTITQDVAKQLMAKLFPRNTRELERVLPAFDNAAINERQFVVPIEWFQQEHTFQDRNDIFEQEAVTYSVSAVRDCLGKDLFLHKPFPIEEVDSLFFVSSTGITTPSIDARCMNEMPFRQDVVRYPLWGLGCAGGVSGIAKASEWLKANPNKSAVVINLEFCSLSFQKHDTRKSNFIGTVLFGDGITATLLLGREHPFVPDIKQSTVPYVKRSSSRLMKGALDVMGWKFADDGFHVIFAKSIPNLVRSFWREHITDFLSSSNLTTEHLSSVIAHPGGPKVLEACQEVLNVPIKQLQHSHDILRNHGNMSSPTVIYVLYNAMVEGMEKGAHSIMSALGPGFSSELIEVEWVSI